MINNDLKNKVLEFLENNKGTRYSIPKLCEEFEVDDDFIMSSIIGELETENNVTQDGERLVYREDGGAITLVLHSIQPQ